MTVFDLRWTFPNPFEIKNTHWQYITRVTSAVTVVILSYFWQRLTVSSVIQQQAVEWWYVWLRHCISCQKKKKALCGEMFILNECWHNELRVYCYQSWYDGGIKVKKDTDFRICTVVTFCYLMEKVFSFPNIFFLHFEFVAFTDYELRLVKLCNFPPYITTLLNRKHIQSKQFYPSVASTWSMLQQKLNLQLFLWVWPELWVTSTLPLILPLLPLMFIPCSQHLWNWIHTFSDSSKFT